MILLNDILKLPSPRNVKLRFNLSLGTNRPAIDYFTDNTRASTKQMLEGMYWNYDKKSNFSVGDILRCELEDGTTFEKDEKLENHLKQKLFDMKEQLSNGDLEVASYLPIDTTPLMLERIRRGDDEAAFFIKDPAILHEGAECGVAIENPKKNDFFFGILLAYS